jgi:heat shock protein HtpX
MNQIRTVALLGLLSGLLIVASSVIFGSANGSLIGLGLAAVMNLGSWFYSDKIALSAYGAQPLSPESAPSIYRMVQDLAERANLPMPGVYSNPE